MDTNISDLYAMRYAAVTLAYQLAAIRMPDGTVEDRHALANGWIHKLVEEYEAAWQKYRDREGANVRAVAD